MYYLSFQKWTHGALLCELMAGTESHSQQWKMYKTTQHKYLDVSRPLKSNQYRKLSPTFLIKVSRLFVFIDTHRKWKHRKVSNHTDTILVKKKGGAQRKWQKLGHIRALIPQITPGWTSAIPRVHYWTIFQQSLKTMICLNLWNTDQKLLVYKSKNEVRRMIVWCRPTNQSCQNNSCSNPWKRRTL